MDEHASIPLPVASSGGVELTMHDFGGDDARPLLAAHATGFNGVVWQPLLAALSPMHRVALDFRAHGRSPLPVEVDLSWDDFADDVLATLDALRWTDPDRAGDRPVGIGHSMGGAAVLLAEIRRPGTFAGLWVYEPIIFPPEVRATMAAQDNPLSTGALRRRRTFPSLLDARSTFASKPPMNAFTADALDGYVDGGFIVSPDGSATLCCEPGNEARIYRTASTCTAFEHLDRVRCPVMVVRGALEAFGPSALASAAAAALADGRLVAHDELSHFGPMEDPEGLAAEINSFVASLGA